MKNKIKQYLISLYNLLKLFGFDPLAFISALRGLPFYFHDYSEIKRQRGKEEKIPIFFGVINS